MSTETKPPTDTPKYIGSVANADEFYCPEYIPIDRASNSFPELERSMMGTFAARRDAHARDSLAPYEAISEIYVRAREVQKLVRALDAYREVIADGVIGPLDLDKCNAAAKVLNEARAALGDIK